MVESSQKEQVNHLQHHLQEKMKSTLIILLIGAFVAVACARPTRSPPKASLQNDGDKKVALKKMDNLLSQALLDLIQEQVALEQEVSTEEDDDDDEDGDKAASQFIHLHFGK